MLLKVIVWGSAGIRPATSSTQMSVARSALLIDKEALDVSKSILSAPLLWPT